jgi:hypothetical protein
MSNTIETRELRHELHNLRKDYIAAVEQIQELQTKPAAKGQWIMVMNRLRGKDEPWGLDTAYSVTELGAKEAMQRALDKMETYATRWPTLECRLQGGEW